MRMPAMMRHHAGAWQTPIAIVGVPTALGGHLSGMELSPAGLAGARAGRRCSGRGPAWPAPMCAMPGTSRSIPGSGPTRTRGPRTAQQICAFLPRERDLVAASPRRAGRRGHAAADRRRRLHGACRGDGGPARGTTGRPATRSPGSMRTATSTRPTRRHRATSGGCRSRCSAVAAIRTSCAAADGPTVDGAGCGAVRRPGPRRDRVADARGVAGRAVRRRDARDGRRPRRGRGLGTRRWRRASTAIYIAFDMDCLDGAEGWAVTMPEPDGLALETALGPRSGSSPTAMPVVGFGATAVTLANGDGRSDGRCHRSARRGGLHRPLISRVVRRPSPAARHASAPTPTSWRSGPARGTRVGRSATGREGHRDPDRSGVRDDDRRPAARRRSRAQAAATRSVEVGRRLAVGPVDRARRRARGRRREPGAARELIERAALGDPEVGFLPGGHRRRSWPRRAVPRSRSPSLSRGDRARHDPRAGGQASVRARRRGPPATRRPAAAERRIAAAAVALAGPGGRRRGGRGRSMRHDRDLATPRRLERRHLVADVDGGSDHGPSPARRRTPPPAAGRARAAAARPRRSRMTAWPGSIERWPAMSRGARLGCERRRDQRGGPGDEAIEDDRDARRGGADDDADEDARSRARRPPPARRSGRAGSGPIDVERALDGGDLASVRPASSMPVPRPVTVATGAPVKTAAIALAAVVLPIPISPIPRRSTPSARSSVDEARARRDRVERLRRGSSPGPGHVGGAGADPGTDQPHRRAGRSGPRPGSARRRRHRRP